MEQRELFVKPALKAKWYKDPESKWDMFVQLSWVEGLSLWYPMRVDPDNRLKETLQHTINAAEMINAIGEPNLLDFAPYFTPTQDDLIAVYVLPLSS